MSLRVRDYLHTRLLLVTLFILGMHALPAYAADAGMTALVTTSTDGKPYAAKFAAGLSLDNGQTFRTATTTGINVLIRGSIAPDPAHIGKKGDLFIVTRVGTDFFMRTTSGVFVPWSFRIPDLVPALEDVTLGTSHTVEVFKGQISEAKDRSIFLGYMPESGAGLIYTPIPLLLSISQNSDPISLFENTIFDQLVMTRCALCHVKGGVADGRTGLLFVKDANLARQNYDIFRAYFNKRDNAYEYTLSKASGGDRHVGGAQVAPGSADYLALTNFLTALDGRVPAATTSTTPTAQFFNGVVLQSNLKTLRRAAILLAGRAPTPAEQATVASGGDAELRNTLLGLMQGSVFHDFLKDGANDRLLVRGQDLLPLQPCNLCFPNYSNRMYKNEEQAFLTGLLYPKNQYLDQAQYGQEEAPLELIASIIVNDRPYSEILTADYMMFNPIIDEATNATATFTTGKATEFRPGRITDYYPRGETTVVRQETRFHFPILVTPSTVRHSYPHVGILNDMAFMRRYPSTATNRNRARARWTYFHFLGVDIEQSAQRTTDPLALADTNNPTMNNPNCQVCHAIMDPVAGAFQHYGDEGFYLESFGGMDALDQFYKFPGPGITTPYRRGDTWYRDMRTPGFNGTNATGTDTLRWLANQIVADPRFASAAVRFWWPAIMGRELLKRPEVATDGDYNARLLAYDAQEAAITSLTANFTKSGLKVKSLLIDLLMSEWFRAERIDGTKVTGTQTQAHWIAGLGNEKLLTPEQLARKTWALTGYNWKGNYLVSLGITTTGMGRDYALYYGGIDSLGVTQRSRELTPLMSATALNMALESSCPIVYGEFILPDAQRKLFEGVSDVLTPLTEASEVKVVDSADATQFKTFSFSSALETGTKKVFISYLNEYCDWDAANNRCRSDRNVFISGVTIQQPDGTRTRVPATQLQLDGTCGRTLQNNMMLSGVCTATYSFAAFQRGTYLVEAQISAAQAGPELAQVLMGFEDGAVPAKSTSRGAALIKQKLVELHQTLLGKTLTVDSPEIAAAFTLLADTWQAKRASNEQKHLLVSGRACNWAGDINHMQYVGFPGEPHRLETYPHYQARQYRPWSEFESWYLPRGSDPVHMKKSWQVVIAYLLTHYNYLYE